MRAGHFDPSAHQGNVSAMSDVKRTPRSLGYVLRRELVGKFQYHTLKLARGIIHVGANTGQERAQYESNDLDVVWIEPIDGVFQRLKSNIAPYARQKAYNALITDCDGAAYTFHIANNDGSSSSILEFGDHRDIFPDVTYVREVVMHGLTLTSLVAREDIDMSKYDMLLLDTQGSELLVLKGAAGLLRNFRFIQVEAADFEAYKGCAKAHEIEAYLRPLGFVECHRKETSVHPDGGRYFELTFSQTPPSLWERLKV
jgi:FkbM family methyltransferase